MAGGCPPSFPSLNMDGLAATGWMNRPNTEVRLLSSLTSSSSLLLFGTDPMGAFMEKNRIIQLSKEAIETADLEEVKDELIFALESSGIEQFEPEVNSDYRGQEKFAEAVKQKQPCNDSKQTGKIAKVIRPGYQYFISEDNIKVVRTAQVKLFG